MKNVIDSNLQLASFYCQQETKVFTISILQPSLYEGDHGSVCVSILECYQGLITLFAC